jgi:hypothetical protein
MIHQVWVCGGCKGDLHSQNLVHRCLRGMVQLRDNNITIYTYLSEYLGIELKRLTVVGFERGKKHFIYVATNLGYDD